MNITPISQRLLLQALAETQEKLEHVTAQLEKFAADAAKYREETEAKVVNLEQVNAEVTARRDYLEIVLKRILYQTFVRKSESSRYDDLPLFLHRGLDVPESHKQPHEASETDCDAADADCDAADADESESQQAKSPNKNKGTGRTRARKKKPLPKNLPVQTCYVDHETPPECPGVSLPDDSYHSLGRNAGALLSWGSLLHPTNVSASSWLSLMRYCRATSSH